MRGRRSIVRFLWDIIFARAPQLGELWVDDPINPFHPIEYVRVEELRDGWVRFRAVKGCPYPRDKELHVADFKCQYRRLKESV